MKLSFATFTRVMNAHSRFLRLAAHASDAVPDFNERAQRPSVHINAPGSSDYFTVDDLNALARLATIGLGQVQIREEDES